MRIQSLSPRRLLLSSWRTCAPSHRKQSNRKTWRMTACFILAALVCFLLYIAATCSNGCGPPVQSPGPFITYFPNRQWSNNSQKLILFWTTKFDRPYWAMSPDYKFAECAVSACRLTANKDDLDASDAVMFHDRDLWNNFLGVPLPPRRHPHQVWVYHNLEPPTHVYLNHKHYQGVFNWTATYRRDSEVFTPYGRLVRLDNNSVSWDIETDQDLKACERGGLGGIEERCMPQGDWYLDKTKSVAWTSSNCIDQGRRQRVVKQIQKYLEVDAYGDCGNKRLECHKQDRVCTQNLDSYRFYLALENAICKDYFTEKMWHTMTRGSIPVVFGGHGYSNYIPRNSYIDVRDFSSPDQLADFIKKVNSSKHLYNSYMWWREHYRVDSDAHSLFFCNLCKKLHDKTQPAQVYTDFDGWFRNDTCQQFSISDVVSRFVEGSLLKYNIIS